MPPNSDTQKGATSLRNARRKYEALPKTGENQLRIDALYAWNDVAKTYFSKRADQFFSKNEIAEISNNPSYAESALKDLAEHHATIGQAARQLGIDPITLVPPFIKFTELQAYLRAKEPKIASDLQKRFVEVGLPTYGFDKVPAQGLESRWFILGCVLLFFALAFVIWGFSLGELTWTQQRLLVFILPLAAGFSAAAFSGSINAQVRNWIPGIAITATSGFAVFLITFFFLFPESKVKQQPPTPSVAATPTPTPSAPATPTPTFTPIPELPPREVIVSIKADQPHWQDGATLASNEYALVNVLKNDKMWTFDYWSTKCDESGVGPTDALRPSPMRTQGEEFFIGALLGRIDSQLPLSFSKTRRQLRFEGPGTLKFMMNDVWWQRGSFGFYVTRDYPEGSPDGNTDGFAGNYGELDVRIEIHKNH